MKMALACSAVLLVAGCNEQSMVQQKRYDTYAPSQLWSNGSAARPLPAGTVAQSAGDPVQMRANPPPLTEASMQAGQDRFDIFCSSCHDRTGDGRGIIVQHGFPAPLPFDSDKIRAASAQHLYDVITDGYGVMYPFASRIKPADRWAIVAYIRALQVSQRSRVADVPDARGHLP